MKKFLVLVFITAMKSYWVSKHELLMMLYNYNIGLTPKEQALFDKRKKKYLDKQIYWELQFKNWED